MIRGRIPVPHLPYRLRETISIFVYHLRLEVICKPAWELLLLATHSNPTAALPSLLPGSCSKAQPLCLQRDKLLSFSHPIQEERKTEDRQRGGDSAWPFSPLFMKGNQCKVSWVTLNHTQRARVGRVGTVAL